MHKKWFWVLGLTLVMKLVEGNPSTGTLRNTHLISKRTSDIYASKTEPTHLPREHSHRQAFEGISHGTALEVTGSLYGRLKDSESSEEYWWPKLGIQNFTNHSLSAANHYSYSKPTYGFIGLPNGGSGFFYKDSVGQLHSRHPYQQIRPPKGSSVAIISTPPQKLREKLQIMSFDTSEKSKFKKTVLNKSPSGYKKPVFSRLVKPHAKHKYPTHSLPPYRRFYYQSPYQRYAIPSSEISRYKGINPNLSYYRTSTVPPKQDAVRRYTTEKMEGAFPDWSTTWEDYSAFNDTNHDTNGNYYEEAFEEFEKTISVPDSDERSYEEGTTRGYYGDRIYMSTQMPVVTSDKTGVKNKYFIIRRTSHDDDVETLFE